jgi:uncharacterized protein (TIGR02594 family)
MKLDWREVQILLSKLGYNPGPIDGIFGPRTSRAVINFKRAVGLRARDYVGAITLAALRKAVSSRAPVNPVIKEGEPKWLSRARMEIGVVEYPGAKHNPRVLGYWELAKLAFNSDETPWCAGFVGAMLEDVGIKSTRSGMARSYMQWGQPLSDPIPGAIAVFWRGKRHGSSGHVGFVTGKDQRGNIMVLGGNQGDAVNVKPFSTIRVLGYRWPSAASMMPDSGRKPVLETVESEEPTSSNEA